MWRSVVLRVTFIVHTEALTCRRARWLRYRTGRRQMIEAERKALADGVVHSSLAILEREMTIILNYINNVSTSAALLAGLYFGYIQPLWPRQEDKLRVPEGGLLESVLICASVLAFGLLMYTVLLATLSTSLAPTKAFKDREHSSMRTAIEQLSRDKSRIMRAYQGGILVLTIPIIIEVWVTLQNYTSDYPTMLVVAMTVLALTVATVHAMHDMHCKYAVSKDETTRSVMPARQFLAAADTVACNSTSATAPATPLAGIVRQNIDAFSGLLPFRQRQSKQNT